jgi:predicted GIY-YIG superfamily endonuclease
MSEAKNNPPVAGTGEAVAIHQYAKVQLYFEATPNIKAALAREKQIKGWVRAKKIALVEAANPEWRDLSTEWYS